MYYLIVSFLCQLKVEELYLKKCISLYLSKKEDIFYLKEINKYTLTSAYDKTPMKNALSLL